MTEPEILLPAPDHRGRPDPHAGRRVPRALPGAPRDGARARPRRARPTSSPAWCSPTSRRPGAGTSTTPSRWRSWCAPSCWPASGERPRRPSRRRRRRATATPTARRSVAVRALRPTDLHRLHGAGARSAGSARTCTSEGREALAPGPGLHPHQPGPHRRRGLDQPDARSSSPSSRSTWWCSSSSASARTPASIDRYAMQPRPGAPQGQYYRAFTAMWLHANFLHIFFNMIALLIVGPAVEVLLGKPRFLALYLIAGLGGSVGSYLLGPPNVARPRGLGGDHGRHGRLRGGRAAPAPPVAPWSRLLVLNFVIGFTGNIDWRAHLGGLVTGAARLPLRLRRRPARPDDGAGAHHRGERGGPGRAGLAHHRCRPRSCQPRAVTRRNRWLTVRQKSPYCFISGCSSGTT